MSISVYQDMPKKKAHADNKHYPNAQVAIDRGTPLKDIPLANTRIIGMAQARARNDGTLRLDNGDCSKPIHKQHSDTTVSRTTLKPSPVEAETKSATRAQVQWAGDRDPGDTTVAIGKTPVCNISCSLCTPSHGPRPLNRPRLTKVDQIDDKPRAVYVPRITSVQRIKSVAYADALERTSPRSAYTTEHNPHLQFCFPRPGGPSSPLAANISRHLCRYRAPSQQLGAYSRLPITSYTAADLEFEDDVISQLGHHTEHTSPLSASSSLFEYSFPNEEQEIRPTSEILFGPCTAPEPSETPWLNKLAERLTTLKPFREKCHNPRGGGDIYLSRNIQHGRLAALARKTELGRQFLFKQVCLVVQVQIRCVSFLCSWSDVQRPKEHQVWAQMKQNQTWQRARAMGLEAERRRQEEIIGARQAEAEAGQAAELELERAKSRTINPRINAKKRKAPSYFDFGVAEMNSMHSRGCSAGGEGYWLGKGWSQSCKCVQSARSPTPEPVDIDV